MPNRVILKADFELRKILTSGQRTEEQEIKTDTLVLGNANLEMRVKGEPHHFNDFVPGSLITVSFTQSQTSMADFDEKQEEDELIQLEDEALEEEQDTARVKGSEAEEEDELIQSEDEALEEEQDTAQLKGLEAEEEDDLEEVDT